MWKAIPRFGARVPPEARAVVADCRRRGALVCGPQMVFADVDPATNTMSPASLERAITPRTAAVVPTHLYGLACDMDAILSLAAPGVFTDSGFPILWVSSWWGGQPDVYLWEQVRHLDPLPPSYTERYSNVQAALGLAGLQHIDEWTKATQRHADVLNHELSSCAQIPYRPSDREHVYYQYSVRVPDHADFVRRALRHGIDVEMLHMDVCTRLPLFAESATDAPGADRAAVAVQLPVYASLTDGEVARIARVAQAVLREEAIAIRRQQSLPSKH